MLPNGLRIIHRPSASPVVYCGYAVNAGTRDELPGEEGMAHFVEHMTFKGTEKRKAIQILNSLERVGGDLNAFTGKEERSIMPPFCMSTQHGPWICSPTSCSTAPTHKPT